MVYRSRNQPQPVERIFDPYALVHRWGWWYAIGACHLRQAIRSFRVDRIAELVLQGEPEARAIDFEPYGYDERQFCSPGLDLPVGRLTRSPNGTYAEYHTSADDLSLLSTEHMAASLRVLARMARTVDRNRTLVNLSPKGEPRLGKRGLYRSTGGTALGDRESALLWTLSMSDGCHDLVAIANRSGASFEALDEAAAALEHAGLARVAQANERISA
jgi:aminopeptidase-like protein